MKIAEHKTPPHCSADTSAAPAPAGRTEVGFTLQTLIVMAVFVLTAVGVSLGLLAVTSASSDDFEEAGQTGVGSTLRAQRGERPRTRSQRRGRHQSDIQRKSCPIPSAANPVCGTWEYYNPGRAAEGIGGPEGNGGLYSSNIGCFAPCYWSYVNGNSRPEAQNGVIENNTSLQYSDDNSPPGIKQIRLGVNYWRDDPSTNIHWISDLQPSHRSNNLDGKPYIVARNGRGNAKVSGKLPLTPALLQYVPTVFKPNWRSRGPDPGGTARNGGSWEDENWEVRADPYNKVCTIVNITLDDQVVCSSEDSSCEP